MGSSLDCLVAFCLACPQAIAYLLNYLLIGKKVHNREISCKTPAETGLISSVVSSSLRANLRRFYSQVQLWYCICGGRWLHMRLRSRFSHERNQLLTRYNGRNVFQMGTPTHDSMCFSFEEFHCVLNHRVWIICIWERLGGLYWTVLFFIILYLTKWPTDWLTLQLTMTLKVEHKVAARIYVAWNIYALYNGVLDLHRFADNFYSFEVDCSLKPKNVFTETRRNGSMQSIHTITAILLQCICHLIAKSFHKNSNVVSIYISLMQIWSILIYKMTCMWFWGPWSIMLLRVKDSRKWLKSFVVNLG